MNSAIKINEADLAREIDHVRGKKTASAAGKTQRLKIDKSIGQRIKEARELNKITQENLAKDITHRLEVAGMVSSGASSSEFKKRSRSSIAQWESGRAVPEFSIIPIIAKAVKCTPEYLAFGISSEPKVVMPEPEELGYVLAPEIVVQDDGSYVEAQKWGLPLEWLRSELGVRAYKDIVIYKVQVNGDPFEYGDRVVIDRANIKPSPPGYFLHWDGFGANITKMMVVPGAGKKPMVKVRGADGDYEIDAGKLTIIGRVKGVWKKA